MRFFWAGIIFFASLLCIPFAVVFVFVNAQDQLGGDNVGLGFEAPLLFLLFFLNLISFSLSGLTRKKYFLKSMASALFCLILCVGLFLFLGGRVNLFEMIPALFLAAFSYFILFYSLIYLFCSRVWRP